MLICWFCYINNALGVIFGLRHMLRSMVKLLICLVDAWWYVVVQEANAARSGDHLLCWSHLAVSMFPLVVLLHHQDSGLCYAGVMHIQVLGLSIFN